MTTPLFSINAAAETLEVDRRTVTKALRRTKPDGKERGQDRWRLKTILTALDQLPGSTGAPTQRRASGSNVNATSDEEFTRQMFDITEAWTRASDAIVAIEALPHEKKQAEAKGAFAKLEALRKAYEAVEPDGLSRDAREILGQMFSGLLHACNLVICEDDGKTPLKSFYGDHNPLKKK
jgi:hypothetical protein